MTKVITGIYSLSPISILNKSKDFISIFLGDKVVKALLSKMLQKAVLFSVIGNDKALFVVRFKVLNTKREGGNMCTLLFKILIIII